jgi:hypothetical protein
MLPRLAEAKVGRQRKGGHQLGQPNARLALVTLHIQSVSPCAPSVTVRRRTSEAGLGGVVGRSGERSAMGRVVGCAEESTTPEYGLGLVSGPTAGSEGTGRPDPGWP